MCFQAHTPRWQLAPRKSEGGFLGAPPREQGGSTRQRENGGPSPPHRSRAVPCCGQGLGLCTPCQLADCRLWVHLPTCFLKGRGCGGDSASSRQSLSLFSPIHSPSPCLGGVPCWSQDFTWRPTKIFIFKVSTPYLGCGYCTGPFPMCHGNSICVSLDSYADIQTPNVMIL